jgi:hypothetical protein
VNRDPTRALASGASGKDRKPRGHYQCPAISRTLSAPFAGCHSNKNPEAAAPGFFRRKCRPLLLGLAEIQGRQFDLRHLDPDLAEVDVERLVEQGGYDDGKAITIATMIACRPIQGMAPQ